MSTTTLHQVYKNLRDIEKDKRYKNIILAVKYTKGLIITYKNKPIEAFYHANSGGRTEYPKYLWGGKRKTYPYLTSVRDPYSKIDKNFYWKNKINKKFLSSIFSRYYKKKLIFKKITIYKRTPSYRVYKFKLYFNTGIKIITGNQLRTMLGYTYIKSLYIKVKNYNKYILFIGKGSGHGICFSQWGSYGMGLKKLNYRQIIYFYYNHVRIKKEY